MSTLTQILHDQNSPPSSFCKSDDYITWRRIFTYSQSGECAAFWPEFNQNAAFVWITFKRTTIQSYNHTSSPLNPSTPQANNPSTPSTPTTSKHEKAKTKRLKALLSSIGTNGSNLKTLMESMQRKDRKGFVSTYIAPNIEAGYIAMLYPESPNHPMQSYYLTKKGRELLEQQ